MSRRQLLPLFIILLSFTSFVSAEGRVLKVDSEPVIYRTVLILPDGQKLPNSIAVGLPGGQNFAFDAEKCILTAAWKGEFLDISEDLQFGGNGSKPLGKVSYVNMNHFPIVDPVKGAPKFGGYRTFKGFPTFIYSTGLTKVKVRFTVVDGKLIQSFLIVNANFVKYKKADGQHVKSVDGAEFVNGIVEKTQQPGKLMLIFEFEVGK
ncbi:MAG: hypothetical protein NE330_17610 [Lentisphaeraceae bacterium]|nr:hypothetical protein [Lentisphaeraceae bacterium]